MTAERSIALGILASQCKDRIAVELERAASLAANKLALELGQQSIDLEACNAKGELYHQALEETTAWHRDPLFVAIAASLLTVGTLLAARHLIVRAQ